MHLLTTVVAISAITFSSFSNGNDPKNVESARCYLDYLDEMVCKGIHGQVASQFNYYTNITDDNLQQMNDELAKPALFDAKNVSFDWDSFKNSDLKRQAEMYGLFDKGDPKLKKEYADIISKMVDASQTHFINLCLYHNRSACGNDAIPTLRTIMETCRDPEELAFYWEETKKYGPEGIARPLYKTYVNVSNRLAKESNFSNRADEWMSDYEDPPLAEFENWIMGLWEQVKPLYHEYFSYVRQKLRIRFGEDVVSKKGPLPIHLTDSLSGLVVGPNIEEFKPYPGKQSIDVTNELIRQNYTVMKIVQLAEDYYLSLGLEPLPESFWNKSMFVMPDDRDVSCDPISFDFRNRKDVRLSMCGELDSYSFNTFMHELGHLHNFVAYKFQPCCYQNNPNPGLDESIGDTMTLGFTSFKHLRRLGLVEDSEVTDEAEINGLYDKFRNTVGRIPLFLTLDKWRWDLFRNKIPEETCNQAFWDYRLKYQGVIPPVKRTEDYLDAAINIIMLDDSQFLSYIITYILEFQNYEALCKAAGEYDSNNPEANPLHKCDLYGSKEAGAIWNNLLKMGQSQPWNMSIETVTGKSRVDAGALLNFFEPLYSWLKKQNEKNGEFIGWE